jgi:hypothetical protein
LYPLCSRFQWYFISSPMNKRLAAAMGAYAVLIAIAVYLLHGKLLYAVLILFGGLIAKTLIAAKAGW